MQQTPTDRPTARPWNPQPGRLNPAAAAGSPSRRERLHFAAVQARLRTIEQDWLFQSVGPEGRRRLLIEHGLAPR